MARNSNTSLYTLDGEVMEDRRELRHLGIHLSYHPRGSEENDPITEVRGLARVENGRLIIYSCLAVDPEGKPREELRRDKYRS